MREKLPDRRVSATKTLRHELTSGKDIKLTVTFGYDGERKIREVFCADFKAGSDHQALIMDACILLSRLLQHGDLPVDLAATMCSPPSFIGTIARGIVAELDGV
jgi:hypothetical protein